MTGGELPLPQQATLGARELRTWCRASFSLRDRARAFSERALSFSICSVAASRAA